MSRGHHIRLRPAQELHGNGEPNRVFSNVANQASGAAGRPTAFAIAALVVLIWGVTGPIFGFSGSTPAPPS
jgi:hypothetical protein